MDFTKNVASEDKRFYGQITPLKSIPGFYMQVTLLMACHYSSEIFHRPTEVCDMLPETSRGHLRAPLAFHQLPLNTINRTLVIIHRQHQAWHIYESIGAVWDFSGCMRPVTGYRGSITGYMRPVTGFMQWRLWAWHMWKSGHQNYPFFGPNSVRLSWNIGPKSGLKAVQVRKRGGLYIVTNQPTNQNPCICLGFVGLLEHGTGRPNGMPHKNSKWICKFDFDPWRRFHDFFKGNHSIIIRSRIWMLQSGHNTIYHGGGSISFLFKSYC